MAYYILHVGVDADEVKVMRNEFPEYLDKCGAISVIVGSPDGEEPSDALKAAIQHLLIRLFMAIERDEFQGLQ